MTFAWYAHLRNLSGRPWYVAALVSWGIALFEYLLQVPANRIGYTQLSLAQLKILQEVITFGVFVPFAVFYMRQPLRLGLPLGGAMHPRRCVLHVSRRRRRTHRMKSPAHQSEEDRSSVVGRIVISFQWVTDY